MEKAELINTWYRCKEEETDENRVYRPRGYAFAPTRMPRETLRIAADGTVALGKPGSNDANDAAHGTWELKGDVLEICTGSSTQECRVISVSKEKLTLA